MLSGYGFLARQVKSSPPDSIQLTIPETIIDMIGMPISYLFTNSRGFLELRDLSGEKLDESDSEEWNQVKD